MDICNYTEVITTSAGKLWEYGALVFCLAAANIIQWRDRVGLHKDFMKYLKGDLNVKAQIADSIEKT